MNIIEANREALISKISNLERFQMDNTYASPEGGYKKELGPLPSTPKSLKFHKINEQDNDSL